MEFNATEATKKRRKKKKLKLCINV